MNTIKAWLYGLLSGFIGGGATSASAWIGMASAKAAGLDVPTLNLKALGIIFISGGITSALGYLKQSPLPAESVTVTQTKSLTTTVTATPSDAPSPLADTIAKTTNTQAKNP